MTLMEAWKDALQLCKPQAMKLMFLVTLNAMRQTIKALFTVWFLAPVIALLIVAFLSAWIVHILVSYVLFIILSIFIYGVAFLAVRPSIQIKNWDYFKSYFGLCARFLGELFVWMVGITALLVGWEFLFVPFGHVHSLFAASNKFTFTAVNYIATTPAYIAGVILYAAHRLHFINYVTFFYLDKVGSIYTAGKKALTLICYNLPILFIYELGFWSVLFLVNLGAYQLSTMLMLTGSTVGYILGSLFLLVGVSLSFLLHFFIFCLVSNIYTKRVHDQYYIYQ